MTLFTIPVVKWSAGAKVWCGKCSYTERIPGADRVGACSLPRLKCFLAWRRGLAGLGRSSMIAHQDHRFPGVEAGDGLKIDFDKDADSKRNAAHARDQKAQKSKEAMLMPPREVPGAPLARAGTPSVSAYPHPGRSPRGGGNLTCTEATGRRRAPTRLRPVRHVQGHYTQTGRLSHEQ
jgi:hypothetical protein